MNDSQRAFLQRLLDAPGPSGYETAAARVWRAEAETFADEVSVDVTGNSFALIRGSDRSATVPKVLLAGHVDEIGFVVTHIDPDGYLWFDAIGGWDDQVVVGQRVRVVGASGDVPGVIGKKAIHGMTPEERDKPSKLRDLWIDIGAGSRSEACEVVEVGDAAVIDAGFVQLRGDLCAARSMDNRVGAYVALEAARLLADERARVDVVAVATAQEETSFAGAMTAAFKTAPMVAIAIDVTHATDHPGADKKRDDEVRLGGGPVLTRGSANNPVLFAVLREVARSIGLDCPVQGTGRTSGTDADAMISSGAGTAAGVVSIPNRYMHSPNEIVSLRDLDGAARLLAAFVRTLTPESDFRPG